MTKQECPNCHGTGEDRYPIKQKCGVARCINCAGTGWVKGEEIKPQSNLTKFYHKLITGIMIGLIGFCVYQLFFKG